MRNEKVIIKLKDWEAFYEENTESLDGADYFDSGFHVAMSMANNWIHDRLIEQNDADPNIPHRICHNCEAPMDYTEDYEATFIVKDNPVTIDRIHAYICPNCGEVVYSSDEAERIEGIVKRNCSLPI